ncbi:MAG: hypothetical protein LPK19_01215, partial [Hymenobacteraceae bacterium]|nr:hypothetical protein [Hymenobacteraceae bacterium]MDX5394793.1 hypothetical protein [Hymenobacteraceae bacterium]MDX5510824.1 hypothetical protein [Hymenobacteraceae bacterium]
MKYKIAATVVLLFLLFTGCSLHSEEKKNLTESKENNYKLNTDDSVEEIKKLKEAVERNDVKQLESFILQINNQVKEDKKISSSDDVSGFPQLSLALLQDFFNTVDSESLTSKVYFEKEYQSFIKGSKGIVESEECMSLIVLSKNLDSKEFTLSLH